MGSFETGQKCPCSDKEPPLTSVKGIFYLNEQIREAEGTSKLLKPKSQLPWCRQRPPKIKDSPAKTQTSYEKVKLDFVKGGILRFWTQALLGHALNCFIVTPSCLRRSNSHVHLSWCLVSHEASACMLQFQSLLHYASDLLLYSEVSWLRKIDLSAFAASGP